MAARKQVRRVPISPNCFLAATITLLALAPAPMQNQANGQPGRTNAPPRFPFQIDPKTPLEGLLPSPLVLPHPTAPWLVDDLTKVPEVLFQKPPEVKKTELDADTFLQRLTAHQIAKINHLNQKETDYFIIALREKRPELAGLPFLLGDACRMSKAASASFVKEVPRARGLIFGISAEPSEVKRISLLFWRDYETACNKEPQAKEEVILSRIATLMQVLATDAKMHPGLVEHLARIEHKQAHRALASLAVYSFDAQVRDAALAALKTKPAQDTSDILLQGLHYPWPAIAKNAAAALVKLERNDLVGELVSFLDEPDPRAPVLKKINGQKTPMVRELVRLNHDRNCLLCHAPANTPDIMDSKGLTPGIVTGGSVPGLGPVYYRPLSPDILVRADITYLRQDFSVLQKVHDDDRAAEGEQAKSVTPSLPMQRFDFLVRSRAVTQKEMDAYREWSAKQGPGYLSPNHHAALSALRSLTRRDAEPTTAAWRRVLDMPR